jgi:glycosyltransferase involved in cell wall biosynthesis
MSPWLSIIVPTIGRASLERLLKSVRLQAPATEVELVVVGDTHGKKWAKSLAPVPALCARYDARYLGHDAGQNMVGQPQRNYGQAQAIGEWLLWSQDDNLYVRGALDTVRQTVQRTQRPHLFRVETRYPLPDGTPLIVWARHSLIEGNIDADCICVPNDPARLGQWTMRYGGDFDFIYDTCGRWGWQQLWQDVVIVRSRPARRDGDWTRGHA